MPFVLSLLTDLDSKVYGSDFRLESCSLGPKFMVHSFQSKLSHSCNGAGAANTPTLFAQNMKPIVQGLAWRQSSTLDLLSLCGVRVRMRSFFSSSFFLLPSPLLLAVPAVLTLGHRGHHMICTTPPQHLSPPIDFMASEESVGTSMHERLVGPTPAG